MNNLNKILWIDWIQKAEETQITQKYGQVVHVCLRGKCNLKSLVCIPLQRHAIHIQGYQMNESSILGNYSSSMVLLTCSDTDGKYVNLEVDTEDLFKFFKEIINSAIVKKFANHVYRRSVGLKKGYNNPFHPEDELTSFFDEAFLKNVRSSNAKTTSNTNKKKNIVDIFEKEKEDIADGHGGENVLTDDERIPGAAVRSNTLVTQIHPIVELLTHKTNENTKTAQNNETVILVNNFDKSTNQVYKKDFTR